MPLHVYVGTVNRAKTEAVRSVFQRFQDDPKTALSLDRVGPIVYSNHKVESGVSPNPRTFAETIQGARNRAKNVLDGYSKNEQECIGVGIESGFILFDKELEGIYLNRGLNGTRFNFDVCCIIRQSDNLTVYSFSQGIEYPRSPVDRILDENGEFDAEMMSHLNPIEPPEPEFGFLGVLTDGRYSRQHVSEIAVEHAGLRLIHNNDYYR